MGGSRVKARQRVGAAGVLQPHRAVLQAGGQGLGVGALGLCHNGSGVPHAAGHLEHLPPSKRRHL